MNIKASYLISWLFLREQQQVHSAPVETHQFLTVIRLKHKRTASLLYSTCKWAPLSPTAWTESRRRACVSVWRSLEHSRSTAVKNTKRIPKQPDSDSRDSWDSGGQLCGSASFGDWFNIYSKERIASMFSDTLRPSSLIFNH